MTAGSPKPTSTAVREARRQLSAAVRTDWTFPWPADASSLTTTPAFAPREPVAEWRPRLYASSDAATSDNDDDPHHPAAGLSSPSSEPPSASASAPSSTFSFAAATSLHKRASVLSLNPRRLNPFSSARGHCATQDSDETLRRRERTRRRRRRREEQEATWNKGLDHWLACRDAWTCAKLPGGAAAEDSTSVAIGGPPNGHGASPSSRGRAPRLSLDFAPTLSISTASPHARDSPHSSHDDSTSLHSARTADSPVQPADGSPPLVPCAPPLLPPGLTTDVTPALYPSIYTKVVMQSLTPSVPINLAHMIPALVAGWKADGEWPPKATTAAVAAPPPYTPTSTPPATRGSVGAARANGASGNSNGRSAGTGLHSPPAPPASSSLGAKGRRLLHHHRRRQSIQQGAEDDTTAEREVKRASTRDSLESLRSHDGGGQTLHEAVVRRVSKVLRLNRDHGSGTGTGTENGEA